MTRRRTIREASLGLGALAAALLLPLPATSPPAFAAGARLAPKTLGAIADTPGNRAFIEVNELGALWRAAGLGGTLSPHSLASAKGMAASREVLEGSPVGSTLWPYAAAGAPLGYNVFGLSEELVVGNLPKQLSEVWGPVRVAKVGPALRALKPSVSTVGGTRVFAIPHGNLKTQLAATLTGVSRIAAPKAGGRLLTEGLTLPESALTGLAAGRSVAHSLASDPSVKAVLRTFPANPTVFAMGSSLVGSPAPQGTSPAAVQQLRRAAGLDRLPASPTFAGLAYGGGPPATATVTAAAIYPNAADAKAAATVLGREMSSGKSLATNQPYSKLWRVAGTATLGNVAEVKLIPHQPGIVNQAIENKDFPLFWTK